MNLEQKTLRRMSLSQVQGVGYGRYGISPKKDIEPVRIGYRPGPYHYVVEWQMEEEVGSPLVCEKPAIP